MPDYAHEALERHIDTQHPDFAAVLDSIKDLRQYIKSVTHNYEEEPGAISSFYAPPSAFVVDDITREVAIAGYSFGVQFPLITISATTVAQFSVFNNGSKTIVVTGVDCNSLTVAGQFYLQATLSDPQLGTVRGSINRKIPIGTGVTGINATYSATPPTAGVPTTFIDHVNVPANQSQIMFSPDITYVLPAGSKSGLLITVVSTGAAIVDAHFHLIELPF